MKPSFIISPSHFEKVQLLGSGSYGKSYLVKEKSSKHICSIKFINNSIIFPSQSKNNENQSSDQNSQLVNIVENISHIVDSISKINHTAILSPRGYSPPDNSKKRPMAIVTEYQENGNLFNYLPKFQSADKSQVSIQLKILFGIIEGIRHLHENQFIHGNLNPGNVLLNADLEPLLTDYLLIALFGYNQKSNDDITKHFKHRTTSPAFSAFVAPEFNTSQLNRSFDIFSFGMIAYSVLTGHLPFDDKFHFDAENSNSKNTSQEEVSEETSKDDNPNGNQDDKGSKHKNDSQNERIAAEITNMLQNGERPNIPDTIPEPFRKLISQCWHQNPENRPTSEEIVMRFIRGDLSIRAFDKERTLYYLYNNEDENKINLQEQLTNPYEKEEITIKNYQEKCLPPSFSTKMLIKTLEKIDVLNQYSIEIRRNMELLRSNYDNMMKSLRMQQIEYESQMQQMSAQQQPQEKVNANNTGPLKPNPNMNLFKRRQSMKPSIASFLHNSTKTNRNNSIPHQRQPSPSLKTKVFEYGKEIAPDTEFSNQQLDQIHSSNNESNTQELDSLPKSNQSSISLDNDTNETVSSRDDNNQEVNNETPLLNPQNNQPNLANFPSFDKNEQQTTSEFPSFVSSSNQNQSTTSEFPSFSIEIPQNNLNRPSPGRVNFNVKLATPHRASMFVNDSTQNHKQETNNDIPKPPPRNRTRNSLHPQMVKALVSQAIPPDQSITPNKHSQRDISNVKYPYGVLAFDGLFNHLLKETKDIIGSGLVKITGTSSDPEHDIGIRNIINFAGDSCWTSKNDENMYIEWDFGTKQICVTHYTLQTYPCGPGYSHLKNWVLEGSNKSEPDKWTIIDKREENNDLNGQSKYATFQVAVHDDFNILRLRATGPNHFGDNYLILCNVEFYGDFT